MQVKDIMSSPIIAIEGTKSVNEAALLMCEKDISVLPILDDSGSLAGIITESDFVGKDADIPHAMASIKRLFGKVNNFSDVEKIYDDSKAKQVKDVMSTNVTTIESSADLNALLQLMSEKNFKRVPVVDGGKLVGMITRKDLIKAFLKA